MPLNHVPKTTAIHLVEQHLVKNRGRNHVPPPHVASIDLVHLVGGVLGTERQLPLAHRYGCKDPLLLPNV